MFDGGLVLEFWGAYFLPRSRSRLEEPLSRDDPEEEDPRDSRDSRGASNVRPVGRVSLGRPRLGGVLCPIPDPRPSRVSRDSRENGGFPEEVFPGRTGVMLGAV